MLENVPEPTVAPPGPPSFTSSATFAISITGIHTASIGTLTNVVRQVDWIINGNDNGQTFELQQKTKLALPDETSFIQLESITTSGVFISWIEENETRLPAIKGHIQLVLDKMVEESSYTNIRSHPGLTIQG